MNAILVSANMPRRLSLQLIASIPTLVVILGCSRIDSSPRNTPRLVVEAKLVNLGTLEPGKRAFTIPVRNLGTGVLSIVSIKSTCKCSKVDNCQPITPGESAEIHGEVDVAGGSGTADLAFISNDPNSPQTIKLSWFGRKPPSIIPNRVYGVAPPDTTYTHDVRILYPTGSNLAYSGLGPTTVPVTSEVVSNNQDDSLIPHDGPQMNSSATSTMLIRLRFKVPHTVGTYYIPLIIRCKQKDGSYELPISSRLDVVGGITVKPATIYLASSSSTQLENTESMARITTVPAVKKLRVKSSPAFLECTLRNESEPNLSTLLVKVIAPPPKNEHSFEVVVEGSSGDSIAVPVKLLF